MREPAVVAPHAAVLGERELDDLRARRVGALADERHEAPVVEAPLEGRRLDPVVRRPKGGVVAGDLLGGGVVHVGALPDTGRFQSTAHADRPVSQPRAFANL
jgi:hypothetical protein